MSFYGEEFRDDVVGIYMKDLKKAPTVEEEKEYLKEIKSGNEDAKKEFIERNLRLVVSIAKEYVGQGIEFPDLIQEGNMGLVKALNYFNPDLGYKFSTYATWWIKQGMTRTIVNDSDQIRKPVHMKEKMKKMMTVEAKLRNKLDREPTLEEVAFEMDMPLEKAAEIRKLRTQMISLDSLITPNKDDDYDRN
ncbi:MAG: sigma-70 family RNA polymerase sigma factor, partial [Bacilli bacterium]|nr:sigma-70 family RNA polymerase sigma factor [Bacilli bacterium]